MVHHVQPHSHVWSIFECAHSNHPVFIWHLLFVHGAICFESLEYAQTFSENHRTDDLVLYAFWFFTIVYVLVQYDFNSLLIRDGLILFNRYITAMPAGIFTSISLFVYQKELIQAKLFRLAILIKLLAVVVFLYTLSTGLLGEHFDIFPAHFINRDAFIERFNIPIEIFRILFAIGITILIYGFMFLYELNLKEHHDRQFKAQIS